MRLLLSLGMIAASAAIISGCSTSEDRSSPVSPPQVQPVQSTPGGVVIKLRELNLREDRISLSGRPETQGRSVSQVGGAVLGAITDESTDDHDMPADTQEITVRFDSGAIRVVTQAKTGSIQLNERVKVITSSQSTRVVPF